MIISTVINYIYFLILFQYERYIFYENFQILSFVKGGLVCFQIFEADKTSNLCYFCYFKKF